MRFSRLCTCCSSMNTPSSPGIEKSSSDTKNVAETKRWSFFSAM